MGGHVYDMYSLNIFESEDIEAARKCAEYECNREFAWARQWPNGEIIIKNLVAFPSRFGGMVEMPRLREETENVWYPNPIWHTVIVCIFPEKMNVDENRIFTMLHASERPLPDYWNGYKTEPESKPFVTVDQSIQAIQLVPAVRKMAITANMICLFKAVTNKVLESILTLILKDEPKLNVILRLRHQTGMGLAESKEIVDALILWMDKIPSPHDNDHKF